MDSYRIRTVHFLKRRIAVIAMIAVLVSLFYFKVLSVDQLNIVREAFTELFTGNVGPGVIIPIAIVVAIVVLLFVIQGLTSVTTRVQVGDSEVIINNKHIAFADIMRMEVAGRGAKTTDPALVIYGPSPIPLHVFETNGSHGRAYSDGRLAFEKIVNRVCNSARFDSHTIGAEQETVKTIYTRRPATLGQIINQVIK
jgi:hypothetical protein